MRITYIVHWHQTGQAIQVVDGHLKRLRKRVCLIFRLKVKTVDLFGVSPLQERLIRLIVFEAFGQQTIDDHLVVLHFATDDAIRLIE